MRETADGGNKKKPKGRQALHKGLPFCRPAGREHRPQKKNKNNHKTNPVGNPSPTVLRLAGSGYYHGGLGKAARGCVVESLLPLLRCLLEGGRFIGVGKKGSGGGPAAFAIRGDIILGGLIKKRCCVGHEAIVPGLRTKRRQGQDRWDLYLNTAISLTAVRT